MAGWARHEGLAVALPRSDIDTDQLIPARFMSASRSEGYGQFLLRDMRAEEADFPLDRHPDAQVLVTGANFGCGSSREGAVYALVDAGITAVLAESFGDIFAGNAVNNGLLPIAHPEAGRILSKMGTDPAEARIDVEAGTIEILGRTLRFELSRTWTQKIVNGWDDIDLTRSHQEDIEVFATRRRAESPWAWPRAGHGPDNE